MFIQISRIMSPKLKFEPESEIFFLKTICKLKKILCSFYKKNIFFIYLGTNIIIIQTKYPTCQRY